MLAIHVLYFARLLNRSAACGASILLCSPAAFAGAPLRSGRELYTASCASCHGSDGRGAPASQVGFDVPLPDFTDCSFASREPLLDWLAVAHRGGPVRAFDETMPSFEAALTDEELERVVAHIKSFCPEPRWPQGELNLPRAQVTSKAYPEDELVLSGAVALEGPAQISGELVYGKRLGARYQVEATLPLGVRDVEPEEQGMGDWAEGAGDLGLGVKRVVFHSKKSGTIVTLAAELFLPTGDESEGFGRGVVMVEPYVAAGQIIGGSGFTQLQGGFELPLDDELPREAFWRFAVGRVYRAGRWGRTFTPMFEFAAARALQSGATVVWDSIPQLHVSISARQHVQLNIGARLPMTDIDARPTELMVFVLWDWFDGGLLEGWSR